MPKPKGKKKEDPVKKIEDKVIETTKTIVREVDKAVTRAVDTIRNKVEERSKNKNHIKKDNKTQPESISANISFKDFSKVELKVGKITDVKDHPNADKLLVLTVDLNEGKNRTIVAGLKNHYKKEDLKGKKAVFVTNLAPATLRGIESDGMILAAVSNDETKIIIIQPEKDIKEGTKIR